MQLQKFIIAFGLVFLLFPLVSPAYNEPLFGVKPVWMMKFPLAEQNTTSAAALAADGTLYQGTFNGQLLAITPQGKIKWQYKAAREIRSSPAIADDGTLYFGSRDGKLYALTPDGQLKWTFATGAWVDSSPAIATDGTVYFGSWDDNFYAVAPDGRLKWKFSTGAVIYSSPAIAADGTIYFGSHDKNLYALDPQGRLKWKFATGAGIQSSPAIATDGTVYISSLDGYLYAVKPDGQERWRLHTGDFLGGSPVLDSRGYIFLAASSNNYPSHVSIDTAGKVRWKLKGDFYIDDTATVTANGQIYIPITWLQIGGLTTDKNTDWSKWHPWSYQMSFNLSAPPNVGPDGTVYACDGFFLFAVKPVNAAPLADSSWPMWRANPRHTGRVAEIKN